VESRQVELSRPAHPADDAVSTWPEVVRQVDKPREQPEEPGQAGQPEPCAGRAEAGELLTPERELEAREETAERPAAAEAAAVRQPPEQPEGPAERGAQAESS
jgi:hypothetical protein